MIDISPARTEPPVAASGHAVRVGRAKRELEQMIDLNPEIMMLIDQSGTVVRANRSLMDKLGLHRFGDVLGRQMEELFACEPPDFFRALLDHSGGYRVEETQVRLGDGRVRTLRFSVVGHEHGDGLRVVIVHDATEEKEAARRMQQDQRRAAVHALTGALMHRVNQPLTVITVKAKLMQMALEKNHINPEELKATLQDIMDMSIQVADTLKRIERAPDLPTERYLGGKEIFTLPD
jgi:PAS domain S-box-containing protein